MRTGRNLGRRPTEAELANSAPRTPADPTEELADDLRRLVRSIASDPARISWLRGIIARHLDRVAAALASQRHPDAARALSIYAAAYRRGEIELW